MKIRFAFPLLLLGILLLNCKPQVDELELSQGTAELGNPVFIGDNFLSGYQDGAFTAEGWNKSVAVLLSEQFRKVNSSVPQPEPFWLADGASFGWSSKPFNSWYTTTFRLAQSTDCQGVTSLAPVNENLSVTQAQALVVPRYNNRFLTVPFATTADWFDPALGASPFADNHNPFYYPVAANPGVSTLAGEARAQQATFATVWLGMENIYSYARHGGVGVSIIPASTFAAQLDSILQPMVAAGAKGAIATIPDFRVFPYYTLVPWNGATLTQEKADSLNLIYTTGGLTHISFHEGSNGFVIDDVNAPFSVRQMHQDEYITLDIPIDSLKCNYLGLLIHTIPDQYSLDSAEVATIDAAISAYNAVIEQKALQYGFALVDMHGYFNLVKSGIKVDGMDVNAGFVTGGFFSLDGYHPHEKGYALIANEFIRAINLKYGAMVPTVYCEECNGVLFPN
jgi:hypothetical protein